MIQRHGCRTFEANTTRTGQTAASARMDRRPDRGLRESRPHRRHRTARKLLGSGMARRTSRRFRAARAPALGCHQARCGAARTSPGLGCHGAQYGTRPGPHPRSGSMVVSLQRERSATLPRRKTRRVAKSMARAPKGSVARGASTEKEKHHEWDDERGPALRSLGVLPAGLHDGHLLVIVLSNQANDEAHRLPFDLAHAVVPALPSADAVPEAHLTQSNGAKNSRRPPSPSSSRSSSVPSTSAPSPASSRSSRRASSAIACARPGARLQPERGRRPVRQRPMRAAPRRQRSHRRTVAPVTQRQGWERLRLQGWKRPRLQRNW
jgi:hypothetical protein